MLLFANVSDQSLSFRVIFDPRECGIEAETLSARRLRPDDQGDRFTMKPPIDLEVEFPPRAAWGWEIRAR